MYSRLDTISQSGGPILFSERLPKPLFTLSFAVRNICTTSENDLNRSRFLSFPKINRQIKLNFHPKKSIIDLTWAVRILTWWNSISNKQLISSSFLCCFLIPVLELSWIFLFEMNAETFFISRDLSKFRF